MEKPPFDIRAFIEGDMDSFKFIYKRYVGRTYNYLYKVTGDSDLSKDIAQNTFLQLWNSRNCLDANRELDGYIFMIARNLLYREIRNMAVARRYEEFVRDSSVEEYDIDIDDNLSHEQIESRIERLLKELPESRRNIFIMRWRNGMSNKEIASTLNVSEKTVSTQVHRTIMFLKSKMGMQVVVLLVIMNII